LCAVELGYLHRFCCAANKRFNFSPEVCAFDLQESANIPLFGGLSVTRRLKHNRHPSISTSWTHAAAPMGAADIANVGDRCAAELRRTRHPPPRHNKLALAVCSIANDRSHLVGKDARE
jgi:hypothetical protein